MSSRLKKWYREAQEAQASTSQATSDSASSQIERHHVIYEGRCQGVGFRWTCLDLAQQLRLSGWVRNRADGSVEMELQRPSKSIKQLHELMRYEYHNLTRYIRFHITTDEQIPLVSGEKNFEVRR